VNLPFDAARLRGLMEEAGVDLVLATTKHNVQYLLGGYKFFFFGVMEAMGMSRYLPALGFPKSGPDDAFYIGDPMEVWQQEETGFWVPNVENRSRSSVTTAAVAAELIAARGLGNGTIAVELPFLPADTYQRLRELLPDCRIVDGVGVLEELRACKQPYELELIRAASEGIVASMLATLARAKPGMTTEAIADVLREEEQLRGLTFDYCLAATGRSLTRAPSQQEWRPGSSLSLDSGGTKNGYIGDLARMAVIGEPSALQRELLEEVDVVQQAARQAIQPGGSGGAIYEAAEAALRDLPHRSELDFEAHGVGLVSHEVPHLTGEGTWPYPGSHATRPLEPGMVLSVETTMRSAESGFVKLEDTLVVTEDGFEAYGDTARGWNVVAA
jgi:Xaa-Pro aminopeptidase